MSAFEEVTELAGTPISQEQLYRMYNRYRWTAQHCAGQDVLEVACGVGQGVGYVGRVAKSIEAGDISEPILNRAREHYGKRFKFTRLDAQDLPYPDNNFDVVVIHEALYYIPDAQKFLREAKRVLRNRGKLLISISNKDLFDFNPSPFSTTYHGVVELRELLEPMGFEVMFWGSQPVSKMSLRQKILRPIKKAMVATGLMPKTMKGKVFLKRLIFGPPLIMPPEVTSDMAENEEMETLSPDRACQSHKIIYCVAKLKD